MSSLPVLGVSMSIISPPSSTESSVLAYKASSYSPFNGGRSPGICCDSTLNDREATLEAVMAGPVVRVEVNGQALLLWRGIGLSEAFRFWGAGSLGMAL